MKEIKPQQKKPPPPKVPMKSGNSAGPSKPKQPKKPLAAQTVTTKKRITSAARTSLKRSAIGNKGMMRP